MADAIGSLKVLLGLDSAQFSTGLKKSNSELSGFAKSAGLAGVAIGAAIAASAVAIGVAIKGAIDNADELSKSAQKVGVTVEELSRLKYAAELSDVSLDGLSGGLKKLSANMADVAGGGTGKASEAFAALGISVTDASGKLKGSGEVLTEVAGKFGGMEDSAGKTALAMGLFGKSGADLIPLLNSGADGLAEMSAEADALGITIDTKTAKSAEAFNDNLTRLKAVGGGVATQLAAGVLPALESVSASLVGAAKNTAAMDTVGRVLAGTIRVLATAAVGVGGVFAYLGTIVGGVASAIGSVARLQFGEAMKSLDGAAARAEGVTRATSTAIAAIWSKSNLPSAKQTSDLSDQIAAPIMQGAKKIKAGADNAAKEAKDAAEKIRDAAERVLDSLLNDDEKFAKKYAENRKALDDARKADLISLERYLDGIARLEANAAGERLTAIKAPSANQNFEFTPKDAPVAHTALENLIDDLEAARAAADDVAFSIDDIFYGFKNNNWATAVSGLLKAAQSVKKAFASGSTLDKANALGGVAQGIGGAIGGVAGGAIGGLGSGIIAGASLGSIVPGIGTAVGAVVGGVIGLVGGLLGSSSAKKKAKREAEERARQAEADRVARIEAARKNLEIRLMELSGDAVGALTLQRKYELETVDDSLKEQQKAVWAAEDLAEAQAKLAVLAGTRRDLEIELMTAMGDAEGALAAQRADYLKGLDESLRPLQEAVWAVIDANEARTKSEEALAEASDTARGDLQGAYDRESGALQATIDKFKGISDSLRSYSASIGQAEDGTRSLAASARAFAKIAAAARLGDVEAAGQLQGAGEEFRAAGRSQARNLLEQLRIDAQVKAAVEAAADTADRQASIAEQQLSALTSSVTGLLQLNASVITVQEAIAALNATMEASVAQQAAVNAQVVAAAQASQAAAQSAALASIAASTAATQAASETTAAVLQRVTEDGDAMITAEAA